MNQVLLPSKVCHLAHTDLITPLLVCKYSMKRSYAKLRGSDWRKSSEGKEKSWATVGLVLHLRKSNHGVYIRQWPSLSHSASQDCEFGFCYSFFCLSCDICLLCISYFVFPTNHHFTEQVPVWKWPNPPCQPSNTTTEMMMTLNAVQLCRRIIALYRAIKATKKSRKLKKIPHPLLLFQHLFQHLFRVLMVKTALLLVDYALHKVWIRKFAMRRKCVSHYMWTL